MVQIQNKIIKEKFKKALDKDIFSILRAAKTLATRKEKVLDIYVLDLQDRPSTCRQGDDDKVNLLRKKIQIETLTNDDRAYFEDYLAMRKDLLTRESLEEILNLDSCFFLAILDGRIVGAICLVLKNTPLRGGFDLDIIFGDDQAYCFQFFILPEFRGEKLGYFLKAYITDLCRKRGFKYLVGAMDPGNSRSIHILSKLGYERYARITVFNQFFLKWHKFEWFNGKRDLLKLTLFGKKTIKL